MFEQGWIGFLVAGLALAGSPGPATLSLAATGAAFGRRGGLGYVAGLTCGMLIIMAATATGVAGLLFALPGVRPVVLAVAAAYFVYLALRIATAPPLADTAAGRRPPSFPAGVVLNLVNPKAYAAMAALFSGFVLVDGRLALDAAAKIAILTAVIVAVNFVWLFSGAALTRFFRDPATNRVINALFAGLLVVSVVFALLL
jgi:threonine/homoserine/homoserine lactone efflux protein